MSRAEPPQIPGLTFVKILGSGGYSDVYEYEQDVTRQPVAVKVLKVESVSDTTLRALETEAKTMAQIADHPYIVKVYSAGQAADGRPYIVLQYYPPPNLWERVKERPMTLPELLRTGIQIASAVETAHLADILHRDIKPANILLSAYGTPALTDFGIAGDTADQSDGDVGVSIHWSPPEVLGGTSNGSIRGDVYSLAATLWGLLVGRSPFEIPGGDNGQRAIVTRALTSPAPSTGRSDIPHALDRLLVQSMGKDPGRRPASAIEFARALQSIEAQERFARTEITLPAGAARRGGSGDTGPARSITPGPPETAPVDDVHATRRAPTRAQPQAEALASPTTARPRVAAKPQSAAPAETVQPSQAARSASRPADAELPGTISRFPVAESPADAVPVPSPPRRRRWPLVVGAAAVGVVALVTGILIAGSSDGNKPSAQGSISVGAPKYVAPPDPPAVTASIKHGNAVFRWRPGGNVQVGDSYAYQITDPTGRVLSANSSGSHPPAVSPLKLAIGAGGVRCIEVTVRRVSADANWSDPACARKPT